MQLSVQERKDDGLLDEGLSLQEIFFSKASALPDLIPNLATALGMTSEPHLYAYSNWHSL